MNEGRSIEMNRQNIDDIYVPISDNKKISYNNSASAPVRAVVPALTRRQIKQLNKRRRFNRKLSAFTALISLLITVGVAMYLKKEPSPPQASSAIPAVTQAVAKPEVKQSPVIQPKTIDTASLKSQIDAIIKKYPSYEIGVSYSDIKTPANLDLGIQGAYVAASTTKVLTAVMYLKQVELGNRTMTESVGGKPADQQLRAMIEASDNPSSDAFKDLLGYRNLETYAKSIGLNDFRAVANHISPKNMAFLLEKLYNHELLNKENTALLLSHMKKASETQYLVATFPKEVNVYHKAGYLKDRAHDAAIVDNGKQPFILVVFTKADGTYNFETGAKLINEIAAVIWAAY